MTIETAGNDSAPKDEIRRPSSGSIEAFGMEDTRSVPSTLMSRLVDVARFVGPYLLAPFRWIHRLIIATVLILFVITSLSAIAAGAIAALEEWGLWDGIGQADLFGTLLASARFQIVLVAAGSFLAGYLFMQGQFRSVFGVWFRPLRDARQLPIEKLAKNQRSLIAREAIRDLASRYTQAWCSQDASSVAAFYSDKGSLQINNGVKAVGRVAIAEAAQEFMSAFPDMRVSMTDLRIDNENSAQYGWLLEGKNTGPGGTGNPVNIRGHETWKLGNDGLINRSKGYFDQADYERQLGINEANAAAESA